MEAFNCTGRRFERERYVQVDYGVGRPVEVPIKSPLSDAF